jgi:hypothetical protein
MGGLKMAEDVLEEVAGQADNYNGHGLLRGGPGSIRGFSKRS